MKLKRILCPIDFSESSRGVLEHAAFLAHLSSATLTAMHVVEPILFPGEYGFLLEAPREVELAAAQNAKSALSDLVSVLLKDSVHCEIEVVIGRPAEAITQAANSGDFDLIVLGARGRTGWRRFVLGSVAEHVVQSARCPVLTINEHAGVAATS